MKKSILFLSLLFIGVSCESDDNNKQDPGDPLFESEYTPLKSFDELQRVYTYYGAKIGDRPSGAISNQNCLSNNTISFFLSNDGTSTNDSIVFMSYKIDEETPKQCEVDFMRVIRDVNLVREGYLNVDITDISYNFVKVTYKDSINGPTLDSIRIDTIRREIYKGDLEVGEQGGYLRLQDKFSRYSGKEKVYQYFKKN